MNLIKKILFAIYVSSFLSKPVLAAVDVDLLITHGTVVTMDSSSRIIKNGIIAVKNSSIIYVGNGQNQSFNSKKTIDAKQKFVIPGLINGHTHVPMTLLRGISDDLDLNTWLYEYIFPAEAKNLSPEFVYWGTLLGCLEMIQTGTTTFNDMYYFEDDIARATEKCGLRAILSENLIDFPVADNNNPDPDVRWQNGMNLVRTFVQKWKNHPLITPGVGPHAPYTVSPEHLKQVAQLANELDIPVQIHIAETKNEAEKIQNQYPVEVISPIQYLNQLGFLSPHVISAHTIWTSEEDMKILEQHQVGVAHCPQSNLKLAAGIADVSSLLKNNIAVSLGTDGAASNNDLILWEEMNLAPILQKESHENAIAMSAKTAFGMATIIGARALHMDKQIGSLEVGKKADVVIVNNQTSHQVPYDSGDQDIYSALVYATKGSDVETVIVNGRTLMQDRKIFHLNQQEIFDKANALRKKVNDSLKKNNTPHPQK